MKELKDYIFVVQNLVPLELCDAVLYEYKECNDWIPAITGDGKADAERQCSTIGVSFSGIIEKNQMARQKIDQELFICASNAIQEYKKVFPICRIEQDSGYDLLK